MPAPLLETKIYLPRPRATLVPRGRLRARLDAAVASKLLVVSAPAGFGRTTLLSEWLAAGRADPAPERAVAWLSLDARDSEANTCWTYVVAALRTAAPDLGADELVLLASAQPPPIHLVLTTLLNDLGASGGAIELVLDDYHLVDSPAIQDDMAFLLDHLPPRLHLSSPAGLTPRWRAAPRDGSRPSSWRRCRCRDAPTRPASSPGSPGRPVHRGLSGGGGPATAARLRARLTAADLRAGSVQRLAA